MFSKQSLTRWHFALGLAVAAPLVVVVATAFVLGTLRASSVIEGLAGPRADAAKAVADVLEHHRVEELAAIHIPVDPAEHPRFELRGGDNEETDWLETIYRIHRGKFAGLPGQIVFSAAGASMLAMLVLGWLIRTQAPTRRTHRKLGLAGGWLIALVMAGGATLNFGNQLIAQFDPNPPADPAMAGIPLDLRAALAAALASYSASPLEEIRLPRAPGAPVLFFFEDSSRIYVDAAGRGVVKAATWTSHPTRALFALHSGRFLGRLQPVWVFFEALLAAALLVSGLVLAIRKEAT